MGLGDEKYLLLTTFKRDGTPVGTPVWAAPLDSGEIGFWTSSGTGKIKAKYGMMTEVSKVLGALGGIVKRNRIPYGDRGVIIAIQS